jgi:hypothetical protein
MLSNPSTLYCNQDLQKYDKLSVYPFTVFKTLSFSDKVPFLADQGTAAFTREAAGPACINSILIGKLEK